MSESICRVRAGRSVRDEGEEMREIEEGGKRGRRRDRGVGRRQDLRGKKRKEDRKGGGRGEELGTYLGHVE
jgi:hypothetical protein